jgi:hypothetical protein
MFAAPSQTAFHAPQSSLERQLIIDFLKDKGYRLEDLKTLPRSRARKLMIQACTYASLRLAEIEARSQFRQRTHFEG